MINDNVTSCIGGFSCRTRWKVWHLKGGYLITVFMFWAVIIFHGCVTSDFEAREGADMQEVSLDEEREAITEAEEAGFTEGKEVKPTEPQSIRIRRKGKTYDIDMKIFPGDENLFVQMDFPEVEEEEEEKEEKPEIVPERGPEEREAFNLATRRLVQAQKYAYSKLYQRALYEVNQALLLKPDFAYAHALKGSVYYKLGRMELAVRSWKTALEHDPSMDDVRQKLGELGY